MHPQSGYTGDDGIVSISRYAGIQGVQEIEHSGKSAGFSQCAGNEFRDGQRDMPLLLDLETTGADESHVVAPFREGRYWGAVSKTHHSVLRFRDPVYKSIRELAMSYFHEYFLDNGQKTLRRFSKHPLDFRAFADDWLVADYPIWGVHDTLITARHERVASASVLKHLRRADPIEITAGKLVQKKR